MTDSTNVIRFQMFPLKRLLCFQSVETNDKSIGLRFVTISIIIHYEKQHCFIVQGILRRI